MSNLFSIAVIGATGTVGEAIINILEERNFPVGKLYAIASDKSVGQTINFRNKVIDICSIDNFDFSKIDLAIFAAGSVVSSDYIPIAVKSGVMVIDNSSAFRYQDEIPLIIPEVNPSNIILAKKKRIIANPNCSTIQMLVALKPIYDAVGISSINVATYQAVSGSGKSAIYELAEQSGQLLNGRPISPKKFNKQIAFNVFPQIDKFMNNGYNREEMKMIWETKKIFADNNIKVNPTTVRVPVFFGHSEAIHLETKKPILAEDAIEILNTAKGVKVFDNLTEDLYPTPLEHGNGHDWVAIGRVRNQIDNPLGLNMWVVSDNIRKGAALNSIQIAELMIKENILSKNKVPSLI